MHINKEQERNNVEEVKVLTPKKQEEKERKETEEENERKDKNTK